MIDSTPKPGPIQMHTFPKFGIALLKMHEYVVLICLHCGGVKALYRQNWDTVVPPMQECTCEVKQS
jgi:hypothetical protein